jgi:hypothetical protein
MKLVLHILLKDLRRHRWEIVLFLLSCAAWTWQTAYPSGWPWLRTREVVPILLFGLWFLITIRVVQGESLVGDREFWLTRPYQWRHLLAAKVCFLILCLNIPLLVADATLLVSAGIPFSWSYLPGLIFLQIETAFYFTFPAAVLATITESLVQWILAVVGLLIFTLIMSWMPWDKLPTTLAGQESVATMIGAAMIVPALLFVLLWQYVRRRVWPARLAFGAAVMMVPLTILIAPTPLVRSLAYARPDGAAPIRISIPDDASAGGRTYVRLNRAYDPQPQISIPLTANSTDPNVLISTEGWRLTLTGDDGWQWQSPWINRSLWFMGDSGATDFSFDMPVATADQLAQKHAKVHLDLTLSVYHLGPAQRFETAASKFSLPGEIFCRWDTGNGLFQIRSGLRCVAPLRLPELTLVEMESGSNTCAAKEGAAPLPAGHRASVVSYGTSLPADFDPDPVHKFDIMPTRWNPPIVDSNNPKENLSAEFCRGTPLTVHTGTFEGRINAAFDLGNIGTEKAIMQNQDLNTTFNPDSY